MASEVMLRRYGLRGLGLTDSQGFSYNPAPGADSWDRLWMTWKDVDIIRAIAWASYGGAAGDADATNKATIVFKRALDGDATAREDALRSVAYWYAANKPATAHPGSAGGTAPSVPTPPSATDYAKQAQLELERLLKAGSNPQTTMAESSSPEAGFFAQLPVLPIAIAGTALLGLLLYVRSRRKTGRGLGHSGRTDRRGGHRMYRRGKYVGYHTHRRGRR
jgi:hypothetical protein